MDSDLAPKYLPKVPLERRAAAFSLDLIIVWLLSAILSGNALGQSIFFILLWLGMRVLLVAKNQGQSLGRWALDMKVVDTRFSKTPGILELTKREGVIALCAALAVLGLSGLTSRNAAVLLLLLPLAIDMSIALTDTEQRHPQAFHDRLAQTIVIGTRRGYSLDIKLKYLLDKLQANMRR